MPLLVLEHDFVENSNSGVASDWSRCSGFLVTGCDDATVRVWDVRRHADDAEVNVIRLQHSGSVCALSLSYDVDMVVCGTVSGRITLHTLSGAAPDADTDADDPLLMTEAGSAAGTSQQDAIIVS